MASPRRAPVRATAVPVVAIGARGRLHEDAYHRLLTRSWLQFFAYVGTAFFASNLMFATLFALQPGSVAGATSFFDLVSFSVETMATIGYGEMAPRTPYAQLVMMIEALFGLLGTAVVTGLTFARVSRPTAKVRFSSRAVIARRYGQRHLMIRVANERLNQIVDARMTVVLLRQEITPEGETMRRFVDVPLVRATSPSFMLTWTALHAIDDSSPFASAGALETLATEGAELFVSIAGIDETTGHAIHARHRYAMSDVIDGARFKDVLTMRDDGVRVLDYRAFDDVEPVDEPVRSA